MSLNQVPQNGQNLDYTKPLVRQNFLTIDAAFSVNHVSYNSGANAGKHNLVTLPVQVADPVTIAGEMALYTLAVLGVPNLFLRQENNGVITNLSTAVPAIVVNPGNPGSADIGLLKIKWNALVNIPGGVDHVDVTFPGTIFNLPPTVQVSLTTNLVTDVYITQVPAIPLTQRFRLQLTGFTGVGGGGAFKWLAIGS